MCLDNFEVPIFIKIVTLGTTFKSLVKIYIAFQKFQTSVCHFWLSSFSEIWDRICATEECRKNTVTLTQNVTLGTLLGHDTYDANQI